MNCCAPGDVVPAVRLAVEPAGLPAVAYPNRGESWDPIRHAYWSAASTRTWGPHGSMPARSTSVGAAVSALATSPPSPTPFSPHPTGRRMWPADANSLNAYQQRLATATPEPRTCDASTARIGGCWVCFPRGLSGPGTDHDHAWSAAVIMLTGRVKEQQAVTSTARAPYVPGLLALRLGPLVEEAVRGWAMCRTSCCWTPPPVIIPEGPGWRSIWAPSWTCRRSA